MSGERERERENLCNCLQDSVEVSKQSAELVKLQEEKQELEEQVASMQLKLDELKTKNNVS